MKTPSRFFSILAFFALLIFASCNEDDSFKDFANQAQSDDTEVNDFPSDDGNNDNDNDKELGE